MATLSKTISVTLRTLEKAAVLLESAEYIHEYKMASQTFEKRMQDAVQNGEIPGAVLVAGDREGKILFIDRTMRSS